MQPQDRKYEILAQQLLDDWKKHLGLKTVEGKQKITGKSGTPWEMDAVAKRVHHNGEEIILVEARRKGGNRKVVQGEIGEFAYRISETESAGGIFVTSIGYQRGAEIVARYNDIETIILNPEDCKDNGDYIAYLKGKFVARQTFSFAPKGQAKLVSFSSDASGRPIVKEEIGSPDEIRRKALGEDR